VASCEGEIIRRDARGATIVMWEDGQDEVLADGLDAIGDMTDGDRFRFEAVEHEDGRITGRFVLIPLTPDGQAALGAARWERYLTPDDLDALSDPWPGGERA
jgi:hypothetical protein